MSFNPTQTLLCHICGEYYTEQDGHDVEKCLDNTRKALAQAEQSVSYWSEQFAKAEINYWR